ncbi:RyR domain containing protein [Olleya phage Harreka_1]|uniref:RyR domain containing protein n=1 Tax=Olleya phage Harreka_1 TaxID=2745673 RepID=A0A8E4ZF99_9CAUD|nr:RyR domain containing protein [Olleya phage Harreka_1]QQV90434.1 RyR domain containing protein [Olleya phage Harreka_1]
MEKLEQIAKTCHAVHKAYCLQAGIKTQPEWDKVQTEHKLTIFSTIEKILSGEIKTQAQSHANFVDFKKTNGWKYGAGYSIKHKTNPRLVDFFSQLPLEDRIKESIFFECVKSFIN